MIIVISKANLNNKLKHLQLSFYLNKYWSADRQTDKETDVNDFSAR